MVLLCRSSAAYTFSWCRALNVSARWGGGRPATPHLSTDLSEEHADDQVLHALCEGIGRVVLPRPRFDLQLSSLAPLLDPEIWRGKVPDTAQALPLDHANGGRRVTAELNLHIDTVTLQECL